MHIDKQRQYIHGEGILTRETKTTSGVRTVTISDIVIKLLKQYRLEQHENRLKLGSVWNDSNNIFVHDDGTPLHLHRPYKWFTDFFDKHNLQKITFHALRHTNASILIGQGIDIAVCLLIDVNNCRQTLDNSTFSILKTVCKKWNCYIVTLSGHLGHADKNVTLNNYTHILDSKEKQAANKMNDFYTQQL